jgi:hypothetical protein
LGCEVVEIQQALLIPMELDLLRDRDGVPAEPARFVAWWSLGSTAART